MKKTNIIILIAFLIVSLFIGSHHEPWADEAQSWLIARDSSVFEIIWDISRYEGTLPLWILTLKIFIILGLTYNYLYIVPIVISTIGVFAFLNKVEAPKYVKILLPFTYYILYQYTCVARSYCYFLLAFSFFISTYNKREENSIKYIMSLIFMTLISMHGILIATGFAVTFFIEILKKKKVKEYVKEFFLYLFIIVVEIILLIPRSDLYMTVSAVMPLKYNIGVVKSIFLGNGNIIFKIFNAIPVILFVILVINLIRIKNKDFIFVLAGMIFFMLVVRYSTHHSGILYYLIIFGVLANYQEIKKKNRYLDKILIIIFLIHISYSAYSGTNDFFNHYSGAKEMAEYIKQNNYEEREIFGIGFKDISLQPYFEINLYDNMDEAMHRWSSENETFYVYCNLEKYEIDYFKDIPELIVIEHDDTDIRVKKLENIIESTDKYEIEYQTDGFQFFKNSYSEREGYTLYKLKTMK